MRELLVLSALLCGCFRDEATMPGEMEDDDEAATTGGNETSPSGTLTASSTTVGPPPPDTTAGSDGQVPTEAPGTSGDSDGGSESSTGYEGTPPVFDFTEDHCAAVWAFSHETDNGILPCHGDPESADGFAGVSPSEDLQSGQAGGPILEIRPPASDVGTVSGTWDGVPIADGDRIVFDVACPAGAPACDFGWQLAVRLDGANPPLRVLAGDQDAGTPIDSIDVDLSEFADLELDFTFAAFPDGSYSSDDIAYFVSPSIINEE